MRGRAILMELFGAELAAALFVAVVATKVLATVVDRFARWMVTP